MLHNNVVRLTEFLLSRGSIDVSKRPILVYGCELALSTLTSFASIVAISILMQDFFSSLLFIAIFFFLRLFSGGFHASTYPCAATSRLQTAAATGPLTLTAGQRRLCRKVTGAGAPPAPQTTTGPSPSSAPATRSIHTPLTPMSGKPSSTCAPTSVSATTSRNSSGWGTRALSGKSTART